MILRGRKLVRDRHAGIVFDWRRGHGSFTRLVMAVVISLFCAGALFAYVKITPMVIARRSLEEGRPVTVMDISRPENQWLARLIEREGPFEPEWDLVDDASLKQEMSRALASLTPALHVPILTMPSQEEASLPLKPLPGFGELPEPDPIAWPKVARKSAQWWIEFEAPGQDWLDFSVPWSADNGPISAGESWGFYLGIDPSGTVVSCIELEGRGNKRTDFLSSALKGAPFPTHPDSDANEIRWWKIFALAVDRNASVKPAPPSGK